MVNKGRMSHNLAGHSVVFRKDASLVGVVNLLVDDLLFQKT